MTKIIRFSAFESNCVGHQSPGLWRHPRDRSWQYKDLDYWTELAILLEGGFFDSIFVADIVGYNDVYRGGLADALRGGVQIPMNDPLQLVNPIAMATKHIGIGITASTNFEHPYTFARRLSTADHHTGSLYADWINVARTTPAGRTVEVPVARSAPGVAILDDWDSFGQTLTASGTATFDSAPIDPADIVEDGERFRYGTAFYQTVLLATLAGIGRSIADETAAAVASRTRTYSHGTGNRPSGDPQVLQVIGRLRGNAYAASAIVLQVARAIERAFQASGNAETEAKANAIAELEASQALTVVTNLVLEASTINSDALGASAIKKPTALDRHWRNARALSSHNPRIYKDRIVGDFAVNDTPPSFLWRIGVTS
ncbi:hypothetical protein C6558_38140 [Ensifer sp. NM-2]|uniref:hypothetical protein n=1 Tax=Ensifer sp. NM-2 TaxID=2109730 RepID=UPI000D128AE0|nr:hypothetical protein [Ensifer sp. NM-2]PSS59479.1 hypothetical protein C6558_38140 [Ensifer sp. NM-2]